MKRKNTLLATASQSNGLSRITENQFAQIPGNLGGLCQGISSISKITSTSSAGPMPASVNGSSSSYFGELCEAMKWVSRQSRSIFVGQGVGCAGTTMTDTLNSIPQSKLLEFPVAEDLQAGFCLGLSIQGYVPVCIFPRWNFLICATNQLVNHIDRLPLMGQPCKVIIRTAVPIRTPFNPGPQHDDDFTDAFERMFRTVRIVRLREAEQILPAYQDAYEAEHSTLLVEHTGLYNAVPSGVKQ